MMRNPVEMMWLRIWSCEYWEAKPHPDTLRVGMQIIEFDFHFRLIGHEDKISEFITFLAIWMVCWIGSIHMWDVGMWDSLGIF